MYALVLFSLCMFKKFKLAWSWLFTVSLTAVVSVKVCCWVYCIDPFSCVDCFNKPSLRLCLGYPQIDWEFTYKLKGTAMLSIQRSCWEIPELFTQISIMLAGTGSTALFTVICSFASRRVPFCANKFFKTVLGFSLVILLWAVDRLGRWLLSAYFFHGKTFWCLIVFLRSMSLT